jgi:hypothetical protein
VFYEWYVERPGGTRARAKGAVREVELVRIVKSDVRPAPGPDETVRKGHKLEGFQLRGPPPPR